MLKCSELTGQNGLFLLVVLDSGKLQAIRTKLAVLSLGDKEGEGNGGDHCGLKLGQLSTAPGGFLLQETRVQGWERASECQPVGMSLSVLS